MAKVKDIIISDRVKTNMGGIRMQNPILSKESIDEGTLDETIGLDESNNPVRGGSGSGSGGAVKRYSTNNIKNIGDEILNKLKCGDVVVKKTTSGSRHMEHCYQVSYYEDKHGCCLTYTAAGYIETQSYDYTDGHWIYNSEDLWTAE